MKPQLALELVRQDALQTEKISKNGYQRTAAIVCKGLPFTIEVKSTTDLRQIELYASLLYDYREGPNEQERPVESSIHVNVMEYKVHVNSSNSASIEIRIKVLSSQLSSLFRVKVSGEICSGKSKEERTRVDILSNPIKVISKLVHPKKDSSQKKTATESIEDAVSRLETQNAENAKLISLLCSDISTFDSSKLGKRKASNFYSDEEEENSDSDQNYDINSSKRIKQTNIEDLENESLNEFESAFQNLVSILNKNHFVRDRTSKYRRLLQGVSLTAEEHSLLSCFVESYSHTNPSPQRSSDESSLAFPSPAPEQLHPFNHFNQNMTSSNFSSSNNSIPEDMYKTGFFSELDSINL